MSIEGTSSIARSLRSMASEVAEQRGRETDALTQVRLDSLGKLILIAADMAADMSGDESARDRLTVEVTEELFDDILYREWPDGGPPPTSGNGPPSET